MISSNSLYIQTLIFSRPINFLENKNILGVKTSSELPVSFTDKFVFVCPNIMAGMQAVQVEVEGQGGPRVGNTTKHALM